MGTIGRKGRSWAMGLHSDVKEKVIRWKQDLNLRGETPSDIIRTIQITRLNDSAIPADWCLIKQII